MVVQPGLKVKRAKFRKLERRRDRVDKGLAHPDIPLVGRLSTMVSGPFQKEIDHGDNQVRCDARLSGRSHQLVKTHVGSFSVCAEIVALSGNRDESRSAAVSSTTVSVGEPCLNPSAWSLKQSKKRAEEFAMPSRAVTRGGHFCVTWKKNSVSNSVSWRFKPKVDLT